jgi:hypothetical protein
MKNLETSGDFGFTSFLDNGLLDTASLGKRNLRGSSTSNNEAVVQSGGEGVTLGILDGDDRKGSVVLLNVHKTSHSSSIVTLGDENHGTQVELDDVRHLSGSDIDLDRVVDLGIRVGVSEGPSVVGDGTGDLVGTNVDLGDSAKLVLSLFSVNSVHDVTSLGIEQQTEAIVCLLQFNNIHETGREVLVSADLSVNLDTTFHADLLALLACQSILQAFTKDDGQGQALTQLVGSLGRARGPNTPHFSDVPVGRSMEALQMFFRSASPAEEKKSH